MNQPRLYNKANEMQRHDAKQLIKEYSHKLQWRNDGCDALLDVGCGSGDVLMEFIYTIMPVKFERVVGSDISPKMITYAKDYYNSYEKCDFRELDISTEKDLPSDMKEKFDHVTSFYCLHWVQNKRQALQNIFNLLRAEGGDCLLVFLIDHPIFEVYKLLSKSSKWSPYMKDVDRYTSPLHYSQDPKLEFSAMLREVGFSDIHVEVKHKVYDYEELENFKDNVKAVNPFWDRIPIYLHESFMNDLMDLGRSFDLRQNDHSNQFQNTLSFPYKLLVAYARKLPPNARG